MNYRDIEIYVGCMVAGAGAIEVMLSPNLFAGAVALVIGLVGVIDGIRNAGSRVGDKLVGKPSWPNRNPRS